MVNDSARAQSLIRRLALRPHPEGGHYREVFRSAQEVPVAAGVRAAATTIYFLLERGQKSLLHRVSSDEIWHYYEGAPLRLHDVSPTLTRAATHRLGPERGKTRQVVTIVGNRWQAAQSTGAYTLVGCTVAPGFDFCDFTLLRDHPREAEKLRRHLPALSSFVG